MAMLTALKAEAHLAGGEVQITILDYSQTYEMPVPTVTVHTNIGVRVEVAWPGYTLRQISKWSLEPGFMELVNSKIGDAVARFFERHDDFKGFKPDKLWYNGWSSKEARK